MGKIDLASVPVRTGSSYPPPHDKAVEGRSSMKLGDAGGLTQFGANLIILAPGARSSLRHWHTYEDEFVMMVSGTCMLVQDAGETEMQPGDCAAFPAGVEDGHCFVNRSEAEARFLVIGTRGPRELGVYSDVDMKVEVDNGAFNFTRKDGSAL